VGRTVQGQAAPATSAACRAGWRRLLLLGALLALFGDTGARAELEVPPLKARVTDLTGTLDGGQRAVLEQRLAAFEAAKGSQIAVLIVPTTQPEAIEQYSMRVAEQWKLGRKGVDDGALLLIAKNDRKLRIEVGRGLEGAVPDAVAKRITADIIAPHFKKGDFYGGITAGVERLMKVVEGEPLPEAGAKSRSSGGAFEDIEFLLIVGFVMVFVVVGFVRAWLGRFGGSALVGGVTGGLAWAIAGTAVAGVAVAVIAFLLSLFGGVASRRGYSGGSSWGTGGWSSGGWSGGSSSDGGFSGGGGDFGGGGASSDW
jgi:uncharacterized protein